MDAVITYVNPMEENWRVQYDTIVGGPLVDHARFEDFGTLRYVLRGIDEHMKFINRVFLVVSSEEQVPDYVNKNKVIVVTHEEFIPKELLPTFNSGTIEAFLWNITRLSEKFIYFNDDMIPIRDMQDFEFFNFGKPCIKFQHVDDLKGYEFKKMLQNCNRLSSSICGKNPIDTLMPLHSIIPYLKSIYKTVYLYAKDAINGSATLVRTTTSFCQFLFSNYFFYSKSHYDYMPALAYIFPSEGEKEIIDGINDYKNSVICINGNELPYANYSIEKILNKVLPNKSKYEL